MDLPGGKCLKGYATFLYLHYSHIRHPCQHRRCIFTVQRRYCSYQMPFMRNQQKDVQLGRSQMVILVPSGSSNQENSFLPSTP